MTFRQVAVCSTEMWGRNMTLDEIRKISQAKAEEKLKSETEAREKIRAQEQAALEADEERARTSGIQQVREKIIEAAQRGAFSDRIEVEGSVAQRVIGEILRKEGWEVEPNSYYHPQNYDDDGCPTTGDYTSYFLEVEWS